MIELNFGKLLLVAVIALIVLGPEKLPKAARMAGATLRRLRLGGGRGGTEGGREFELEEIRRNAKEAADHVDAPRKTAADEVRAVRTSTSEAVAQIADDVTMVGHRDAKPESRDGEV